MFRRVYNDARKERTDGLVIHEDPEKPDDREVLVAANFAMVL